MRVDVWGIVHSPRILSLNLRRLYTFLIFTLTTMKLYC